MISIDKEPIEADVLIVGGGIGGLMAAINAANQGVRVVIAEKANTKRSGSGATGNDHFICYIPEIHGDDIESFINILLPIGKGASMDRSLYRLFLEQTFDRVKDWDSWGISMKPTGDWEYTGHAFPGKPRFCLKYAGHNQKAVLTKQAKKAGARIENHLPITDIITSGGEVVGAIGLGVKEEAPVLKIIRAKSVILTTGAANRLYPPENTPGWMFNIACCPSSTGSGHAMAFRAGAKLVNMEMPFKHAGPKYFSRCGKGTWIGVYREPNGKAIGYFVDKPTKELGDSTGDLYSSVFTDMLKSGKGPAYMDCTETSEDDLEYMKWGMENEGLTGMLDYMEAEGIDVRKHLIEFAEYEPNLMGKGIEIDQNAKTNVEGLYAAGDLVGNFRADLAGATIFGWIAGKSAADRAKNINGFPKAEDNGFVKDRAKFYSEIIERDSGPGWKEANVALQQIMKDYAGTEVRTETLMKAGLKYLRDLKRKTLDTLKADNSHTLMRALETIDLITCGEILFMTALERKETRALHKRPDFPLLNPLLDNKLMSIQQEDGRVKIEWRDAR